MKKSGIIFSLLIIAVINLSSFLDASAQMSRKPSPTREPAGAMSKTPDSAKRALNKINSREDFDSMARVYHQGTPYALPHEMFIIDRKFKNKIYYVNSQKYRFHKDFLLANYFEESAKTAKILNRRAVLLYGIFNEPPKIMENGKLKMENEEQVSPQIAAFDYAPFSLVFPRAACVVHQGGVGTTSQVLRAGVPHLIMPYSHDQPDNAARCERLGVARIISRDKYTGATAARELRELLSNLSYKAKAVEAAKIVEAEHGTKMACDAIEEVLKKKM